MPNNQSSPTPGVSPALTEAEWQRVRLWNAGKMVGGKVRGMAVLDLPADHRHGAAAIALHGQPYGFSWEDVEALEHLLRLVGPLHAPDECHSWTRVNGLALRIQALLPPSDTTGARE